MMNQMYDLTQSPISVGHAAFINELVNSSSAFVVSYFSATASCLYVHASASILIWLTNPTAKCILQCKLEADSNMSQYVRDQKALKPLSQTGRQYCQSV